MRFTLRSRQTAPVPLARLILDTRKYKRLAGLMTASLCLTTLALYLMKIYPVFLPADITNPAALKFMTSSEYTSTTQPFFWELKAFNTRNNERDAERPSDFFAIDSSQFGLVVTLSHRLTPQEQSGAPVGDEKKTQQYKYDNTITVKPYLPVLILFCMVEMLLIGCAIYILTHRPPNPELAWEEHILRQYFAPGEPESAADQWRGHAAAVKSLVQNFHAFALQLNRRYNARAGLPIKDEYDIQDVLHALLKLHFRDVRTEEPTPSYAGSTARMDFLLADTGIVIETKMARPGHADKQIGAELLLDVAHYAAHPQCSHLICFIYDPGNSIVNAAALQNDIAQHPGRLRTEVIVSPVQ